MHIAIRTGTEGARWVRVGAVKARGTQRAIVCGMTIKRSPTGWCVRLESAAEAKLFGTWWIPLPLTAQCSEVDAVAFAAKAYDSVVVVER